MRYVPDLIPKKSRVSIDFNLLSYEQPSTTKQVLKILSFTGTALCLITALGTVFSRFFESAILWSVAAALLPHGYNPFEKVLKFKFTWLLKSIFISILFVALVPISQHYTKYYKEVARKEQAEKNRLAEEQKQKRLAKERKEKERQDSLNYYASKAEAKLKSHQYKSAIQYLSAAVRFTDNIDEFIQKRADSYLSLNDVNNAVNDYSILISSSYNKSDNYYSRALCYKKLKDKRSAIADLKEAIQLGNTKATKVYEQLNPLKRRILYYVTRCCDGTTSNATGRGACSHHHGVCDWNDPVYEEYRDY